MKAFLQLFILLTLLAVSACQIGETKRRTDYAIEGLDISHHQDSIDWEALATEDFDFVFAKATEGLSHVDTRFSENWAAARQSNIARGAYHFFRPELDPYQQFDHFAQYYNPEPGDLPPMLDVEVLDNASPAELIVGVGTWLYLAELRYGTKPIIYSSLKFYYHHLAGHFDDYPLWIARYSNRPPAVNVGANLSFWQYGSEGRVAGIEGPVDLNVFLGDSLSFEKLRMPEQPVLALQSRPKSNP